MSLAPLFSFYSLYAALCFCTWLSDCNWFKWQNGFPLLKLKIYPSLFTCFSHLDPPIELLLYFISVFFLFLTSCPSPLSVYIWSHVSRFMIWMEKWEKDHFFFVVDMRGSAWQPNVATTTCGYMCLILYAFFWQRSSGWLLLPLSDPLLFIMSVRVCGCVPEKECA